MDPDIQSVHEVKVLILESVNVWKNCKKRIPSRSSASVNRPCDHRVGAHRQRVTVYSQLSGLEDVGFNDFIKNDCIPEGDGQVVSGSESLPDPVVF